MNVNYAEYQEHFSELSESGILFRFERDFLHMMADSTTDQRAAGIFRLMSGGHGGQYFIQPH